MAFNKTMAAVFAVPAIDAGDLGARRRAATTRAEKLEVEMTPAFTPIERVILLMLCNKADRRTAKRFARQALMAEEVGVSRATMIRTLTRLELLGWVVREKRYRASGKRTTDMMTVRVPKGVAKAPDRLLPLVSLITGGADYVAPCDIDYVAPCDLVGANCVSPCDSISLLELSPREEGVSISASVDKRSETDPAVVDGMMELMSLLGRPKRVS